MSRRAVIAVATAALGVAGVSDALAGRAASARGAAAAPVVEAMIAGRSTVLLSARRVRAGTARVAVGAGKRCAVAAATPLAALSAARRRGGPAFRVRDYGNCSAASRDAGQLYVFQIGSERAGGQDGWEYKVDQRSGTAGAADPSGPRGDGRRLARGQRVLWFWCLNRSGNCQHTLGVTPSSARVAPGGSLSATVLGYDDRARGTPAADATVTLGAAAASTDASGRATLVAPATPGTYELAARADGLVPSFPEQVVVG